MRTAVRLISSQNHVLSAEKIITSLKTAFNWNSVVNGNATREQSRTFKKRYTFHHALDSW